MFKDFVVNFRLILISLLFCFSSMFAQANDEFVEAVKDSNLEKVKILLKTKVNLNASDSREMT